MPNYYADPNAFQGATDSQRIQQAVDAAARTGSRMVVIPACNARTGTCLWEIEETIELPSHIYIEINNAHLRILAHKLGRTLGIFWLNASETLVEIKTEPAVKVSYGS